jgi:hypothetical protein
MYTDFVFGGSENGPLSVTHFTGYYCHNRELFFAVDFKKPFSQDTIVIVENYFLLWILINL